MNGRPDKRRRMSGRIFWHYFGRQLAFLIIVTVAVSFPLVLVHLIPLMGPVINNGLPFSLLLKAIPLFFPLILYLSLPVAVAIAVGRFYDAKVADNEITALLSAGSSKFGIAVPGLSLSLISLALCYVTSAYWAPKSVTAVYGINAVVRHYLSFTALPEGKYTEISKDVVIYLRRWSSKTGVEQVHIADKSKRTEWRFLYAQSGEFTEVDNQTILVLRNGRIDFFRQPDNKYRSVEFKSYTQIMPTLGAGSRVTRTRRGPREQTTAALFDPPPRILARPKERQEWRAELYRRFTAPFLCLAYGLLCIGVVLSRVTPRRDRRMQIVLLGAAITAVHLFFFLFLVGIDMHAAFPVVVYLAAVASPFVVGSYLLFKSGSARGRGYADADQPAAETG